MSPSLAFPLHFGKIRVWELSWSFDWNDRSQCNMVSWPEFWPQGLNYWIQILTLPLTGLMILYLPWILEWNNIIASLSQGCFWVSYEGLWGQSLLSAWSTISYHSCQLTLPLPRALMKRYWVPWTFSRLFFFPFPLQNTLPSPVWFVKPYLCQFYWLRMLSAFCQTSERLRRLCVTMPTGICSIFSWTLSQSSLSRPRKG